MTYAMPSNLTNVHGLAGYVNSVTDGMFFTMILFAFYVILFMSLKSYNTERAWAASSFITMVIAIFFGTMTLVPSWVVLLSILLAAISLITLRMSNNKEF
ncbi:hypothetical protein KKF45_05520 [Patescibacteria group bacterium]|nr:hypothetical protein [Patescibacteria group bacterium]